MNIIKRNFRALCQWADRSYWHLPRRTRHFVGWCIVVVVLSTAYSGIYGCYRLGKAIGQYCQGTWNTIVETDEEEAAYAVDARWSSDGVHRQFPVGPMNPKRSVNLQRAFNDINDTQLSAATRLGIKPIENREQLEATLPKLVELHETRYYKIDHLTHSVPYLVPDAADFLTALGELFHQYSGTHSRFIITSVLRTRADVKRLSRNNVNSSQNSCHFYATTIDITYNRFDRHGQTWDGKLKTDLARALYDLRAAGHCYVKYESKQACFHITVRPRR